MKAICVFGDSLSKGVVFDKIRKRYAFIKDSFVNLIGNKMSFHIENFAKFGCTIGKGKNIIQKNQEAIQKSDFVVLEFGGNDSDFAWDEISKEPEAKHLPKTPLNEFAETYADIILQVQETGKKPVILNLPPLDAERYFAWISRGLNSDNILRWLGGSEGFIYRWHEMYNMQVCRLANYMKVPLIDIRSTFLEKHNYSDFLCVDGIHPNEAGHRLISSAIEEAIPLLGTA